MEVQAWLMFQNAHRQSTLNESEITQVKLNLELQNHTALIRNEWACYYQSEYRESIKSEAKHYQLTGSQQKYYQLTHSTTGHHLKIITENKYFPVLGYVNITCSNTGYLLPADPKNNDKYLPDEVSMLRIASIKSPDSSLHNSK